MQPLFHQEMSPSPKWQKSIPNVSTAPRNMTNIFSDVCHAYPKYKRCAEVTNLQRYCDTNPEVEFFKTTINYICNAGRQHYLENVKCLARVDYPHLTQSKCNNEQHQAQESAEKTMSMFKDDGTPREKPMSSDQVTLVKQNLCVQFEYNKCMAKAVEAECGDMPQTGW